MKEKLVLIKNKNKVIHGILNISKNNKILIIFIHGFGADLYSHLIFNGARYFVKKGYSTFRYNMYGKGQMERSFEKTTYSTMIKDLENIIKYFSKSYNGKIVLIGHSLGGFIASKLDKLTIITKIVMWEPTLCIKDIIKDFHFNKSINMYMKKSSLTKLLSVKAYNSFNKPDLLSTKNLNHDTLIIINNKNIIRSLKPKKNLTTIILDGYSHGYDFLNENKVLYNLTYKWLTRYNKI